MNTMIAISMLVDGKSDTELLQAMVKCLVDNENDILGKLRGQVNQWGSKSIANVEVLAAIVSAVESRGENKSAESEG